MQRWTVQRNIRGPFIANRTQSPKIAWLIVAALRFVYDMANLQPRLACLIVRVGLSRNCAALLASKSIAIKNKCSGFFGDVTLECWLGLGVAQDILTGL